MNDAVDRVLMEREALDQGFSGGLVLATVVHGLTAAAIIVVPILFPARPRLDVSPDNVLMVALPTGGGGPQSVEPAAAGPPVTQPPAPPKAEAPKIIKPPKDEPRKGLPPEDAKKTKGKPQPSPPPARGGAPAGTGTAPQTPGLSFGPPGPGVPGGTDPRGDYYLASVQQKIWIIWNQQVKGGTNQEVTVSFTILADGQVTDIRVVQSSSVFLFDQAAQRAIALSAPFTPLPKTYGTNRYTIQAVFKPLP